MRERKGETDRESEMERDREKNDRNVWGQGKDRGEM